MLISEIPISMDVSFRGGSFADAAIFCVQIILCFFVYNRRLETSVIRDHIY